MKTNKQLLITGCYRSGTTYVALLLNNHPDLVVGLHTTNWFREFHGQYFHIMREEGWTQCVEEALYYAKKRWNIEATVPKKLPKEYTYATAWNAVMSSVFGSKSWGEKQQLVWTQIPNFLEMFPKHGRTIHVLRDPRSILASFREYTHAKPPAYLGSAFNTLDSMQYALRYKKELGSDQYMIVRYEDVVQNPQKELQKMLSFLNLPMEKDSFSQKNWKDVPGVNWNDRSSFDDPDNIDVHESAYRWKRNLSEEERRFCEAVNGLVMQKFGYEPVEEIVFDDSMKRMCEGDKRLEAMRDHWLKTGNGSEEFPRDSRNPQTWMENVVSSK